MFAPLDVFLWVVAGVLALSIVAIFWAWASSRLNEAAAAEP